MKPKLRELVEIQIGYQAKGRIEDDPDGTYQIIQSRDCSSEGQIRWDELLRIEPHRDPERYVVRDGDVLFLAKGGRRTAVAVNNARPHTIAVSTFYILRVGDGERILPEYLAWYLSNAAHEYLTVEATRGTTVPLVPSKALANLPVDVPSKPVQKTVAALGAALQKERRLTSELAEKRAQLITALCVRAVVQKER
jgi:hypothetical protein